MLQLGKVVQEFDRFNLCLCAFEIPAAPTEEEIQAIMEQVVYFNRTSPGGSLKPRFTLDFTESGILKVCQDKATEAPSRQQFDAFIKAIHLGRLPETSTNAAASIGRSVPSAQQAPNRQANA